jgi:hypothetical protein
LQELLARQNIPSLITCLEGSCSDIESIDAEFNVELGKDPRGKRIHSHIILDVKHNCKVTLDLGHVRSFIPAAMDDVRINSVYVNVRMIATDVDAHNYLRKDDGFSQPRPASSDPVRIPGKRDPRVLQSTVDSLASQLASLGV